MTDPVCPTCGYVYRNHDNYWGKVCIKCGTFIPQHGSTELQKSHARAKRKALRYVQGILRSRFKGDNNANK